MKPTERLPKRSWFELPERGAILPLLALLALVIVMFATLIIDLSSYANQREQAEEYARLAALGALEAHFASNQPSTALKVTDALNRANNVSGVNVLFTERGTGGKLYSPALPTPPGVNGAQLIPGRWELGPATPGNDPCGAIGQQYPCFVENIALDPARTITAYQVRGQIYDKFSTKLARTIFNRDAFPVDVLAVATVVARHACFVIDVSGSLLQDTHPRRTWQDQKNNPLNGRGSAVYVLGDDGVTPNPENPGESAAQNEKWNQLMCSSASCPNRPTNGGNGANSWYQYFQSTNDAGADINDLNSVSQTGYQHMHFKNDYRKLYIPTDSDYALFKSVYDSKYPQPQYQAFPHPDPSTDVKYRINTDPTKNYRHLMHVDVFRKPPGTDGSPAQRTMEGPQPIQTVFAGLRSAIQFFKTRRVGGDMACVMFVDSKLAFPRFVKMTNNFDYLEELTDFGDMSGVGADDPASYGSPSNSSNILKTSTKGFELIARHLMLPIGSDSSKTNIALGLNEALSELANNNTNGFSSDSITIITDSLANCQPQVGGFDNNYDCNNDYQHYVNAMNDVRDIARDRIQGRNITVNWILVGGAIGGHTLDYRGADGNCITEEEARLNDVQMVLGGWDTNQYPDAEDAFENMSTQFPFYESLVIPRQIAVGTKGLFGVLRSNPDNCTNTVCTCNTTSPPSSCNRITQDPTCRTKTQQIQDFMQKIIGDNPYTLVQVH